MTHHRIWSASHVKPCTNVPIRCPVINCTEIHWKYNFPQHLREKHDMRALDASTSFLSLLLVSREEQIALGIPPDKVADWLKSQVTDPGQQTDSPFTNLTQSPAPPSVAGSPSRRRAMSQGKENVDPQQISSRKRRRIG
ncbi:hypothetical protein GGX14DRAFT_596056 [Mycena pura]|uniref:Uncharacterized protein n=1 Tax=Mycena pura TaxID=153505 RepID=A0AAD6UX52_9AGAR|nr:hypothetical protein GGX14DRAFT_596056 [Mycena pura]